MSEFPEFIHSYHLSISQGMYVMLWPRTAVGAVDSALRLEPAPLHSTAVNVEASKQRVTAQHGPLGGRPLFAAIPCLEILPMLLERPHTPPQPQTILPLA